MTLRKWILVASAAVCLVGFSGCKKHGPTASDLYNDNAAVDAGLPYPVMDWRALTSGADREAMTTATLFGNDTAIAAARSGQAYTTGAVLGLVTWRQKEDAHWFGGRIPDEPVSVEFVAFGPGVMPVYRHFAGTPMVEQADSGGAARVAVIEGMKIVRLP
jgi:hypothetical protein